MSGSQTGGALSRVNQLVLGNEKPQQSIFTIHHWSDTPAAGLSPNNGEHPRHRRRRSSSYQSRARLLVSKVQESALNFLARWLLVNEWQSGEEPVSKGRYELPAESVQAVSNEDGSKKEGDENNQKKKKKKKLQLQQQQQQPERRKSQVTRSGQLLSKVPKLADKRLITIVRFIFWRWLTWANFFEFALIVFLIIGCIFQCYELLNDYYRYPVQVSLTKATNEDFKNNLPGITICDNNRMSKEKLRKKHPDLNLTHFIAMTLGTFKSVNDFELPEGTSKSYNESDVDWKRVAEVLSNETVAGTLNYLPERDIVDTITCANIWGEQRPCQNFRRVKSYQNGGVCVTLFHDSVFWDPGEPAVVELNAFLERASGTSSVTSSLMHLDHNDLDLIDLDRKQIQAEQLVEEGNDRTKLRLEMGNLEVLRLRINFHKDDYANPKTSRGAELAVHPKSEVGRLDHINFYIRPGQWYSYYLERSDARRLPAPYENNCYDYQNLRTNWLEKSRQLMANSSAILALAQKQAADSDRPQEEYLWSLRERSFGQRDCLSRCESELTSLKCDCWSLEQPYYREYNFVDLNGTMRWCKLESLLKRPEANQVAGDGLFFQLCGKDVFSTCLKACLDECDFSTFDVTEQSRAWPSDESRRYITDKRLLNRLKLEGSCCATVSILYASLTSSMYITEPKYSRQDMVTIISGNIEAWIGLSAVHAYLFFEQFYDALVEAKLISPIRLGMGSIGSILNWFKLAVCGRQR